MSSLRAVLLVGLAIVSAPVPALACPMFRPRDPADVKSAEIVVTGQLTNYRRLPLRETRDIFGRPTGWAGGHAEFDLTVERALVGRSPRHVRVRWSNSTFAEPEKMPDGRYLVALYRYRPPDGSVQPEFNVFQRPCSGAFLLESGSPGSLAVLRVLEGKPPYPPDPPPPPPQRPEPTGGPAPAAPAAPAWPAAAASWPAAQTPVEARIPLIYWPAVGLAGAALAVAFGALVWRRKPDAGEARSDGDDPASD